MMRLIRKSFLVLLLTAGVLALSSCSSSSYSSPPPGSSSVHMGVSYYNGFYGNPWYGPGYRPPVVVVPPRPTHPIARPPSIQPMPRSGGRMR